MSRGTWVWGIAVAVYAVFFVWYTDLRGPLSPDEIEGFLKTFQEQGFDEQRLARLRTFMENDTGRQFLMVNVIDMAERPPDVEGAEPGESAERLMDRYMEHMYPQLFMRACHPVVAGRAIFQAMDLHGIEGAEEWTMGAMMRYRSRRAMMEVVAHPAMSDRHRFKIAALDKTIAFPIETQVNLGDPRVLLALALFAVAALLGTRAPGMSHPGRGSSVEDCATHEAWTLANRVRGVHVAC